MPVEVLYQTILSLFSSVAHEMVTASDVGVVCVTLVIIGGTMSATDTVQLLVVASL